MSLTPVPENLQRATLRLEFPPSYVVVGIYRLFTDKSLSEPAWVKCAHAVRRGAIVGSVWALATFSIQRKFIEIFLAKYAAFQLCMRLSDYYTQLPPSHGPLAA